MNRINITKIFSVPASFSISGCLNFINPFKTIRNEKTNENDPSFHSGRFADLIDPCCRARKNKGILPATGSKVRAVLLYRQKP